MGWDYIHFFRHLPGDFETRFNVRTGLADEGVNEMFIQLVGTRVIELRGDGAKHRHVVHFLVPELVIALVLLLYIPECVECTPLVDFVQCDHIGEI